MCSKLNNTIVILKIIRLLIPFVFLLIGSVILFDKKKFASKEKYDKYENKYLILVIAVMLFIVLSSIAIFVLTPSGGMSCDGMFIDIGSKYFNRLVHYCHVAQTLLIPIYGVFILYIILSSLSKKLEGKKDVFLSKLLEVLFVILAFVLFSVLARGIEEKDRKATNTDYNNPNWSTAWKPIMYIYPEEELDLTITFDKDVNLIHTYPKYENEWNIHVSSNGNIYDYKTDRNYYALYWDEKDYQEENFKDGFVVKGKDISKFFEEKLEILGFNEREVNEFIIYWMPKMEDNEYNLIRFRTTEEINKNMPIHFSVEPDTLIRVIMDYKKLDEYIEVEEQQLTKVERKGFTIVEWGGRELD